MKFLRRSVPKLIAAGAIACGVLASPAHAQGHAKMDEEPPRPFAKISASALSLRDSIVAFARRQVGVPYRRGASSPDDGFDCSGLAKYVMGRFNIRFPRSSREQALVGKAIQRDIAALKPGDLLTFGRGTRVSHIGIYVGGGRFVHAPRPGARVREGSLFSVRPGWWQGARRIIASTDTAPTSDSLAN